MSDNNHNNANVFISNLQGLGHRSHFNFENNNQDQQLPNNNNNNLQRPNPVSSARFSSPATVHSWRTNTARGSTNPNNKQSFNFDRPAAQNNRGRNGKYQSQTMRHSHSHVHHHNNMNRHNVNMSQQQKQQPQTMRLKSYHHGARNSRYSKQQRHQSNEQRKQEMLKQGKKLEKFMSEMHHIFHEHHFDNKDGVRRTVLWQLFEQEKEDEHEKQQHQNDATAAADEVEKEEVDENDKHDVMDITVSQFRTLLQQAKHLGLVNIEFRKTDPAEEQCPKQVFIHLCENGLGVPEIVNKFQQNHQQQQQQQQQRRQLNSRPVRAQTARNYNAPTTRGFNNYNGINAANIAATPQAQTQFQTQLQQQNEESQAMKLALETQQMQLQMQFPGMQQDLQQFNQLHQQNLQLQQQVGQLQQFQPMQLQSPSMIGGHNLAQLQQGQHLTRTVTAVTPQQVQRRRSSDFHAKTIKCSFCPKRFYNQRGLKQHSLQRHAKALGYEYTCKYCNYHFTNDIEYNQHLNDVHANEMLIGASNNITGNQAHGNIVAGAVGAGYVNNDLQEVSAQFAAMSLYSPVA